MTPECTLVPYREKMQDYDHNSSLSPKISVLKAEISPWTPPAHTAHLQKVFLGAGCYISHTHTHEHHPCADQFPTQLSCFFFPILTPSGWVSTYRVSPSVVSHSQRQISRWMLKSHSDTPTNKNRTQVLLQKTVQDFP